MDWKELYADTMKEAISKTLKCHLMNYTIANKQWQVNKLHRWLELLEQANNYKDLVKWSDQIGDWKKELLRRAEQRAMAQGVQS